MSLENHLQDLFVNTAAISAIVGAGDAARIFFVKLPQGVTYPALVITRISGLGGYHLRGSDGKQKSRIQIDGYAATYTALKDAATGLIPALEAVLSGYTGSRKGTRVFSCLKSNEAAFYEDSPKVFRTSLDYLFIDMETG